MMIRYASAFLGTVVAIRFIKNWRGQSRNAKAAYDEKIMAKAVQEVMPGASLKPDDYMDGMDLYLRGVVPDFDDFQGSYLIRYEKAALTALCISPALYNSSILAYAIQH